MAPMSYEEIAAEHARSFPPGYRRLDGRTDLLDQCRNCYFKISAPCFVTGQTCPNCGEVARIVPMFQIVEV